MKLLGGLLAVVLFGAVLLPQSAGAKAPKYNNQLQVTGMVLPAQHVVVDEQGNILEILSNTAKDVRPKVYRNDIAPGNRISMTPEIYEQYRQIVPEGHSHVGTLYRRAPDAAPFIPLDSLTRQQIAPDSLPLPFPVNEP